MIGSGFVDDALAALQQYAPAKTDSALAAAGINANALLQPDFKLDAAHYARLWLAIADEIQCEFFRFGQRPMPPGSFAMLCHAALSSDNLEHAIRRSLRFFTLLIGEPKGELILRDGLAVIVLREVSPARPAFAYRTFFLILYGVLCWLVKRRLPIHDIGFRGTPPAERPDYLDFFGTRVRFFSQETSLAFDPALLSLKIHRSKAALRQFLAQAPANILLRYRYDRGSASAIHKMLRETPPADWPDFAGAAKILHISEPTLRRHLQADGMSYSSLKEELRRQYALSWLQESDKSVGVIAAELGYAEPSAFHRAFKKWTGTSPALYRSSRLEREI
ncbi:AraC family transcriptional regulator [Pseudochrobactrum sp. sp1633]|uniref:AraC family transcriptional regulator n=1 Tax=Pseudochrobactrum sp. sp1633 TaxID=3036706 RepID=UPI0025A5BF8C|nr:AraC family transcriptional regulator [Pseudochrobactrum sp. sp1633]MDM8344467.1 AraC family transcriptional regulator [Pseudochrobactrum sp. sp1633]HWD14401.1 AraC family transcriptional regulator [Pseudochrobactrum sp.]